MLISQSATVVSVLILLIVAVVQVDADAVSWTYDEAGVGPKNWSMYYSDCGGKMQSPIDIITADALYDAKLNRFNLSDYGITDGVKMKLSNKGGHTAEVEYEGKQIFLRGGNLPDDYELLQFHFHWGEKDEQGSEHLVDGKHFPMELHIVHKQAHIDKVNATSHPYGLAVLGFLFNVTETNNTKFDQLLKHFDKIQFYDPINKTDNTTEIETFPLLDLLPGDTSKLDFYRYFGSLTTPPCSESVIWSVATELIQISEYQLNIFRNLHNDELKPLVNDFRPTQELHYREVTTTKMPATPEQPTTESTKTCNNKAPTLVGHQLGLLTLFIVALYLTLA